MKSGNKNTGHGIVMTLAYSAAVLIVAGAIIWATFRWNWLITPLSIMCALGSVISSLVIVRARKQANVGKSDSCGADDTSSESTAFARVNACLVCDLVRNEGNGKLTLLGLLGEVSHVTVSVAAYPAPVTLTFVLLMAKVPEPEQALVSITNTRTGVAVIADAAVTLQGERDGNRCTVAIQTTATYASEGTYLLDVSVGGRSVYATTFVLGKI